MKSYGNRPGPDPGPCRTVPGPAAFRPAGGAAPPRRGVPPMPALLLGPAGRLALLAGLLLACLLPSSVVGQAGSATLRGWVLVAGTDAPLPVARVQLLGLRKVAVTDSAGRFEVAGLPPGVVEVQVQYLGLGTQRWNVPLHAQASTAIVFRVRLGIIPVPAVHVSVKRVVWPKMRGFESRMQHREGTFITRDEIQRRQPQDLSDLLRTVPGLTFEPPSTEFEDTHVVMGHGRLLCTPTLYMDGHRVSAFQLDDFAPEHIEAIEVYTRMSLVPGQYRIGPSRCGAILLWSRDTF